MPATFAHRLGRAYGPDPSRHALSRSLPHPSTSSTERSLTADGELVPARSQIEMFSFWSGDYELADSRASSALAIACAGQRAWATILDVLSNGVKDVHRDREHER